MGGRLLAQVPRRVQVSADERPHRPRADASPRGAGYPARMAYTDLYDRTLALAYDPEYSVIRDPSGDRAFYADLARETGGPVLELGCGTGRVLLPIAEAGIACVGLDRSPSMLDVLRDKHPPPNLEVVEGSMTSFDLGAGRFQLV